VARWRRRAAAARARHEGKVERERARERGVKGAVKARGGPLPFIGAGGHRGGGCRG
jgi:hypothetical protein